MRSLICVLTLVPALLAGSTAVAAADPASGLVPAGCPHEIHGVFWGGTQWLVLGQALAADPSPCAEYSVTVPPQDDDRTTLRPRAVRRAAGARQIHPVAEIRWTSATGLACVGRRRPPAVDAGTDVLRRRRDCAPTDGGARARRHGRRDVGVQRADPEVLENAPGARAEVLEFLRGLYDGDVGMPKARGIVFNVGIPSTSDAAQVAAYKASVQAWLTDEPFWSELDRYVDVFANEVYVSSLSWGVSGTRSRRARRMNDYFQHMATLAEAAPQTVQAAPDFLRRTYMPLANASWPHPLIGDTHLLSAGLMQHYVSSQVYALRQFAEAHPRTPQGLIGFAWAPVADPQDYRARSRRSPRGWRTPSTCPGTSRPARSRTRAGLRPSASGARARSREPGSTRPGGPSRTGISHDGRRGTTHGRNLECGSSRCAGCRCATRRRAGTGPTARSAATRRRLGFGHGDGDVSGEIEGRLVWANSPRRRQDGVWTPNLRGMIATGDGDELLVSIHGQSVEEEAPGRRRAILARVELTTEAEAVPLAEHVLPRRGGRDRRGARGLVARRLRLRERAGPGPARARRGAARAVPPGRRLSAWASAGTGKEPVMRERPGSTPHARARSGSRLRSAGRRSLRAAWRTLRCDFSTDCPPPRSPRPDPARCSRAHRHRWRTSR